MSIWRMRFRRVLRTNLKETSFALLGVGGSFRRFRPTTIGSGKLTSAIYGSRFVPRFAIAPNSRTSLTSLFPEDPGRAPVLCWNSAANVTAITAIAFLSLFPNMSEAVRVPVAHLRCTAVDFVCVTQYAKYLSS